jgi:glutathione peroxidase
MRHLIVLTLIALVACTNAANKQSEPMQTQTDTRTIHDFKVKALNGGIIDFSQFKGKKILIVNVASECGYTYQYEDLQKLSEEYKEKLVIVGFPSNDFGGQEPGSAEEIQQFCQKNYSVTFPLAEKVNIKTEPIAPIYQWLTTKANNGVENADVTWNFNKFLIDENGRYIAHFGNKVKPYDDALIAAINK